MSITVYDSGGFSGEDKNPIVVTIDQVVFDGKLDLFSGQEYVGNKITYTFPFNVLTSLFIVYNNEIHILGTNNSPYTQHYKLNGTEWISASTLPFNIRHSIAIIHNNEIHLFGGKDYSRYHYKFNGTEWTSVSTVPFWVYTQSGLRCGLASYNNEIHCAYGNYLFKFNGTEWLEITTSPHNFMDGAIFVYNNKLHTIGGDYDPNMHYEWDGTEWKKSDFCFNEQDKPLAVILNNEVHLLNHVRHISFTYTKSTIEANLPYGISSARDQIFIYDNSICIYYRNYNLFYIIKLHNFLYET